MHILVYILKKVIDNVFNTVILSFMKKNMLKVFFK